VKSPVPAASARRQLDLVLPVLVQSPFGKNNGAAIFRRRAEIFEGLKEGDVVAY